MSIEVEVYLATIRKILQLQQLCTFLNICSYPDHPSANRWSRGVFSSLRVLVPVLCNRHALLYISDPLRMTGKEPGHTLYLC